MALIDLENNNKLYFSIKEVASHFDVNESLLRSWEKEFEEICPRKTKGGSRQYTKKDIEMVSILYSLVKERGLTHEGARKALKANKDEEARRIELINKLESIKKQLSELKDTFEDL